MYVSLEADLREAKQIDKLVKLRKDGMIPGVIFGKGMDSISIKIPYIKLMKLISGHAHIIELNLASAKHLVNIESIQRDPVSGKILHVTFHKLQAGQVTSVSVPIILHGIEDVTGIVMQKLQEVYVSCLPENVPGSIDVNVSEIAIGDTIYLRDVSLPVTIKIDEEDLEKQVVSCVAPSKEEEAPAATEGGEDGAEAPAAATEEE